MISSRLPAPIISCVVCGGCLLALAANGAGNAVGQADDYLGPCALVAAADGKTLYVANAGAREVLSLTLPAGSVDRRFPLPEEPSGLELTPDGTQLIVTCGTARGSAVILDLRGGRTVAQLPVGHTPMSPVVSPDGKRLYVCNRFQNDVSVIDLPDRREIGRVRVVREPVAAAVTPTAQCSWWPITCRTTAPTTSIRWRPM